MWDLKGIICCNTSISNCLAGSICSFHSSLTDRSRRDTKHPFDVRVSTETVFVVNNVAVRSITMLGNHKYRALVFPGKLQIAGIQMERFIIQVVKSHEIWWLHAYVMYGNDQFQDIIGTDYCVGDCLISITVDFHFFGLTIVLNFDDVLNDIWLAVNDNFCDNRSHSAIIWYVTQPGTVSIWRSHLSNIGIPIIKITGSHERLFFITGIFIPGKTIFILRWDPRNRRCRATK